LEFKKLHINGYQGFKYLLVGAWGVKFVVINKSILGDRFEGWEWCIHNQKLCKNVFWDGFSIILRFWLHTNKTCIHKVQGQLGRANISTRDQKMIV